MSVYINVIRSADYNNPQQPVSSLVFTPVRAVNDFQRATWGNMADMPLEDLIAPFKRASVPVALAVIVNKPINQFTIVAGFVKKPKTAGIAQVVRPDGGVFSRIYYMDAKVSHFGNAEADVFSRARGFTPRMMRAFNVLDLRAGISHVSVQAVTAGPYAWMSYGGLPGQRDKLAQELQQRLARMKRSKMKPLDAQVCDWVASLNADTPDDIIRSMFNVHVSVPARRTLKALMFGDKHFLTNNPDHRFFRGNPWRSEFYDPIDFKVVLKTQDHAFQEHFEARVNASIEQSLLLPRPKHRWLDCLRARIS